MAIIYCVLRFNQYLYGNKFKLITDHKPLVTIFGENKAIPQFATNRLRRWALIMPGYHYEIKYISEVKIRPICYQDYPQKIKMIF